MPLRSLQAPVKSAACPGAVFAGTELSDPEATAPPARSRASAGMTPRATASSITPAGEPSRLTRIARDCPRTYEKRKVPATAGRPASSQALHHRDATALIDRSSRSRILGPSFSKKRE